MEYYILPKHSYIPPISPQFSFLDSNNRLPVFISPTLQYYTDRLYRQISTFEDIYTKTYISQLYTTFSPVLCNNNQNNIFCYEIMEIFSSDILHYLNSPNGSITKTTVLGICENPDISKIALKLSFPDTNLIIVNSSESFQNIIDYYITRTQISLINSVDRFIFDIPNGSNINTSQYIHWLLLYLLMVMKYQMNGGNCAIKIYGIHFKPIVEIIYIFTKLYTNTIIVRPSITPQCSKYCYLVCTNYCGQVADALYTNISTTLCNHLNHSPPNSCISSLFSNENHMPIYFLSKLDEINIILSRAYFSIFEQIIAFMSNSNNINKHKSLENIQKIHLEKYYTWRQCHNICNIYDNSMALVTTDK